MNYSEWKIKPDYVDGKTIYHVFRHKDKNAIDHSGNREYKTDIFRTYNDAKMYADYLNMMKR